MEYCNIWDYKDSNYPFQLFLGGRGTGKTFSALSDPVLKNRPFIYMRRTLDELDLLQDANGAEGANPFRPINEAYHRNIGFCKINKKISGIYNRVLDEEGKWKPEGQPIGWGVSLSTVSSIRGVDFSSAQDCIFDEFIPEKHVKRMKGECDALLNAYETINRNREFKGLPPMGLYCLSNASDIYNPVFVGLGIVSDVEKMIRRGQHDLYLKDRGLAVHLLAPSEEFLEAKSNTALAKLTRGSSFYKMAYENDFSYNDFSYVKQHTLTGYVPICGIDTCYIWRKKGSREYYVTYAPAKVPVFHSKIDSDVRRFHSEFGIKLYNPYVQGRISFESYELKAFLLDIIL